MKMLSVLGSVGTVGPVDDVVVGVRVVTHGLGKEGCSS